jgi:hypothetical protein
MILLINGSEVQIDDEDFPEISKYRWRISKSNKTKTYIKGGPCSAIYMHRFIMQANDGFDVDHIDGDTFNNKRSNLRICIHSDNLCNSRRRSDNKSGHRGIGYDKKGDRWVAETTYRGSRIRIGRYKTKEEAVAKYEEYARELFGVFYKEVI